MNQLQNSAPSQNSAAPRSAKEEKLASFTKVVLGLTETVWDSIYQSKGNSYEKPTLVMFSGQVQSEGCGAASSDSGPDSPHGSPDLACGTAGQSSTEADAATRPEAGGAGREPQAVS